ncbi:ABC-2 type transporter [Halothece sp. PCC 7418]|uniref:ABC transporter permease n=1 Tax=Halothece sp. (strain PCC 7418) TaxID=65093 RepID=UPI0002A0656A|nr:ABC transporter permease [Halothece sp. PCC 7418]AFZ44084.1 ABC-2 type transporter [Halothece sp. PCC 7418]
MFSRMIAQCRKELAQFKRDRVTVALAFLLPLGMMLIYGFAIRLEAQNLPLSIHDYDNSPLSRSYVERLFATNQFVPIRHNGDAPHDSLDSDRAIASVVIPPDFSRQIKANKTVDVQVLVDGSDVNNARIAENSIRATTNFFIQTQQSSPPAINAEIRLWFNPGGKESLYIVPGSFAVVLWVFPSMLSAIAVVREKEQGTILQVYASDLKAWEWLFGKVLAYVLIATGEAILVMGIAALLFGIRLATEPTPLIIGTLFYLIASVSFGVFVGTRSNHQNSAVQGTAIAGFLSAFLLSGFIYRVENFPLLLSLISHIIPARYYLLITRDALVRGTGWIGVWYAPLMIGAIALLLLLGSTKIMSRMQLKD